MYFLTVFFSFFLKSCFQIKILPRAPECHVGASVSFSFSVAGTLRQGSQSIPQRPCRISTHHHFVGEEAEVLSFMGGPARLLQAHRGTGLSLHIYALGHSERPGPGGPAPAPAPPAAAGTLPPSSAHRSLTLQVLLPWSGSPSVPSTQVLAARQPVSPHSPAALGPNSGPHQGPSPAGISRGQALSQPGLSPGYLCSQAGQESSGSLCLAPAGCHPPGLQGTAGS